MSNKKAGHTDDYTFGSSAIFSTETRRFPSPDYSKFGFFGHLFLFFYYHW
jgi:hypothetical protein